MADQCFFYCHWDQTSDRHQIKVGGKNYLIDVQKIPYFQSFLRSCELTGSDPRTIPEHEDIPFFEAIQYAVTHGCRHFFRRMSDQLSDWHQLCETLDFLSVNVTLGMKLAEVFDEAKSIKQIDYEEPCFEKLLKLRSRDSAFRLLYLFMRGEVDSTAVDKNMAYNATLFVASHQRTFGCRTRKMVLAAHRERFEVTPKQRKELDKWPVKASEEAEWDRDEETTESDYYYDSDLDYGSDLS